MELFNFSEKDTEKYDVASENGTKIKFLPGKTKYVLAGKVGEKCDISYKTINDSKQFMVIMVDTGLIEDGIYQRGQAQELIIPKKSVLDINITEGFLKETVVTFTVVNRSKLYCFGVDYIVEPKGKSRRYSCGRNIEISKEIFDKMIAEMGFFSFFNFMPLETPIEIPLRLDKFLMEKIDEFGKTRVFFKDASWFFINGYLIRTGNKLFIQPFALQNVDEVSRNGVDVCIENWIENQVIRM